MEIHPTPFPGKTKPSKFRTNRKIADPPKPNFKEPPIPKQKRVFGTARSTNIPAKTVTEKPTIKPSTGFSQKQPKLSRSTANTTDVAVIDATDGAEKKSPEKNRASSTKKKSVCFRENAVENPAKVGEIAGPRTPVPSPSLSKPKVLGTPYHSAQNCSKCRFDRLETSSYWLGQIKLAESVGKHFVSAAFFRLALECKAEPIRNLRVELKRYMGRHDCLSAQTAWRDVSLSYGLLKDESNEGGADSGPGETSTSETTGSVRGQEQKELKEEPVQEFGSKKSNRVMVLTFCGRKIWSVLL
ncbi:hypothetical protein L1049_012967 [Liquidambar formosana]|uniref:Uncharacterized protein n=1 Tax=Liquidambar formosana TaxID=63359 RepID=A0AAP0RKW0_LIQFO